MSVIDKPIRDRFLAAILNSSDDAIIARDLNGIITTWNRAAEVIFGYSAKEAIGHASSLLAARNRNEESPALIARVCNGEIFHRFKTVRRHKDGTEIAVSLTLAPIKGTGGHIVGICEIARNFTDRAIADQKLSEQKAELEAEVVERKRAEELFRLVIEAAPNAMIMVSSSGCISLINQQTEFLFGYKRQELLGKPVEMLVPERFRREHEEQRRQFFFAPSTRPMGMGRDLFGLRKDGMEVPIEIGLNPMTSSEGDFVLASVIDITERKRAEERFRLVVEAAPSAMIMISVAGRISLVNSQTEKLFGYKRDELVGKYIQMLFPERFRDESSVRAYSFFSLPSVRAASVATDLFGRRKDGTEVPIEVSLNPIANPEGLFLLVSIIDITERKRYEDQLKSSIEEKQALLQEIHHRVKNNLQTISSLVSLQLEGIEAQETIAKLQDTQHRIKSMAMIHEQLYSHQDMSSIDLAEYVRALLSNLFSSYARSALLTYTLDVTPTPITIEQAVPCGLILNELITNALKYAYPKGKGAIAVQLSTRDGFVSMTVSDQGVGLPSDLDLEKTQSLGMTLIHILTAQLDGKLEIERTSGASFTITFPKLQPVIRKPAAAAKVG